MSLPRKKPYGCFVTTPCAYLQGGRVCICLYTHSQPKCQENDIQQGREPSGAVFCQELRLPAARQQVNMGTTRAVIGGMSSLGAFWHPALPGGCCCRTAVKDFLQPHKELPACTPTAVLGTLSEGVPLAQGPIGF